MKLRTKAEWHYAGRNRADGEQKVEDLFIISNYRQTKVIDMDVHKKAGPTNKQSFKIHNV